MPTYEYRCSACKHELEIFQSIKDAAKRKCPACGQNTLDRLISGGGAILFKGSGFYETDYRSSAYQKAAAADKPAGDAPASGSDAKPAAAADAKPTADKPSAEKPAKASASAEAKAARPSDAANKSGKPAPKRPPSGPS